MLEVLHSRLIERVDVYVEGSWGDNELGKSDVVFTVFGDKGVPCSIEMDTGSYGVVHIGLKIENNRVVDYDGVMSFPEHVVDILTDMGYNCEDIA